MDRTDMDRTDMDRTDMGRIDMDRTDMRRAKEAGSPVSMARKSHCHQRRNFSGWRACGMLVLGVVMALTSAPQLGAQQVDANGRGRPELGSRPGPSFLTVNQDRLFKESLYGERVTRERDTRSRALAAENRKIEAALSTEEKSLTQIRKTALPADFRKLADAFDKKVQGIRRSQDGKARALTNKIKQEQKLFYSKILPILTQLLREKHAVAILDRRAILVASSSMDVTGDALRRIDATLGDGKIAKP